MLRNYLAVARRHLLRHPQYTAINLLGLSIALACCIVAYLNHDFAYSFDAFHEQRDEVYRVYSLRGPQGELNEWGVTPMPLGPAAVREVPGVEQAVRLTSYFLALQHEEQRHNERIVYADTGFFDLFTFPVKYGTAAALRDPNQLILSDRIAKKFFGNENPVGTQMTVRRDGEPQAFTVGAVLEPIPANSSITFGALTGYSNLGGDFDNWRRFGYVTFLHIPDPAALADVEARFPEYAAQQNLARPDWGIEDFRLVPFSEMFVNSQNIPWYYLRPTLHPAAIAAPSIIAALLLLMACFNFMNTALAYAGRRFKEIGVRKVMGGRRGQLIVQFLGETLLLCAVAFVVALLLAVVFVPAYSSLWPNVDLHLSYTEDAGFLLFLLALLLGTGVLAGAYPALYISRFNPVRILMGRQHLRGGNWLTRVLLTLQLTIAGTLIIASLVFAENARYQETLDHGYDYDQVVAAWVEDKAHFDAYRDAVAQYPGLEQLASSDNHIFYSRYNRMVSQGERQHEIATYGVGVGYLETMGLRLQRGRFFEAGQEGGDATRVVVNQKLARQFMWDDPIGQGITIDSTQYTVVGVVSDFLTNSVWGDMDTAIFMLAPEENHDYLVARVPAGQTPEALAFMKTTWHQIFPEEPFTGYFQEEVMVEARQVNGSILTLFLYIGGMAILIAAMGLFALVSLTVVRRTKEIGVRKVLGASLFQLTGLLNRELVMLLFVAAVVAAALSYFSLGALIDSVFRYNAGISMTAFLIAALLLFFMAALSIGRVIYRSATANPVEALRYE